MTEAERQMLLQFMGVTYGEAKKLDQGIIHPAGNLKGTSEQVKGMFQQVLVSQAPPAPPPQPPPTQSIYQAPQPGQVVVPPPPQFTSAPVQATDADQHILVEISQKLDTIIELLKANQNEPKHTKTRTRKVSKLNIQDQRAVHPEG